MGSRFLIDLTSFLRMVTTPGPISGPFDSCLIYALATDPDAASGSTKGGAGCGINFGKAWTQVYWSELVKTEAVCVCGAKYKYC